MFTLGFIGRILVLNIINNGCAVTNSDKNQIKSEVQLKKLIQNNTNRRGIKNLIDCIRLFRKPNAVMLFVPASAPVDSVINDLLRNFSLDNLSQAKAQLFLKRYSPKGNSKAVEPNF